MLFEKQYILTQTIETETRYRTETRTDSEGNTYTVEVPYTYYICNVKLENFDLSHLPIYILTEEQMGFMLPICRLWATGQTCFPTAAIPTPPPRKSRPTMKSPGGAKGRSLCRHDRGGGKVCGLSLCMGRQLPQAPALIVPASLAGLSIIPAGMWDARRRRGFTTSAPPVSPEQAKPGDLVFFVGTYDTAGMSHVGLYVGNSVMLHCGDPISYTNLNSSYWQQHFYCYGRLP